MALFILRYCSNLIIFSLGLYAPGIIGNLPSTFYNFDHNSGTQSSFENVS
jgi:hypothetical protein